METGFFFFCCTIDFDNFILTGGRELPCQIGSPLARDLLKNVMVFINIKKINSNGIWSWCSELDRNKKTKRGNKKTTSNISIDAPHYKNESRTE